MSGAPDPGSGVKQAHVFLFDAVTINQFYYGVWAQKSDRRIEFKAPEFWGTTAKLCERGKLDGIFFADLAAGPNNHRDSYDPAGRDGAFFPAYDPLLVAGIIASHTTDLGIIVTVPTTWTHPYRVARSFSTLDHLSRGRAGWNIVFSNTPAAARAYGRERPLNSDEYYALADEYIDVAYKLWEGSWDEGAVVADKEARVYVEPGAVHSIEHSGEHFQVDAANYVDPGPQRLPVLAQASGTARGTAFAAKNAELILVGGPTREYCAENIRGIHQAAAEAGRAPGSVKTTALVDVIVGPTREAARAKAEEYDSFITLEGALAFAESKLNPEEHDDDVLLADLVAAGEIPETDGVVRYFGGRTVGDVKESFRFLRLPHRAVGTPAEVADEIESWLDDDGLDAINLRQWHCFDTLTEFVELVVPELRRRGRFRAEYTPGETLRERLFDAGPWVGPEHPAHRYRNAFSAVPN
jgi:FMN-dependent oxidoreductase (nitrilotriacetate monooxygenase family)